MSNYVSRFRISGYEDNEPYLYRSCILKHWPSMWPEEQAAEAGLWRERFKQKQEGFTFRVPYTNHNYLLEYGSPKKKYINKKELAILVLRQLAKENNWKTITTIEGKLIYKIKSDNYHL